MNQSPKLYQKPNNNTPVNIPQLYKNPQMKSKISLDDQRQKIPTARKVQIFLSSFIAYTSVHALRTTYSFSKSYLPQQIDMQQKLIGIVDSVMLLFIGLGNFMIAIKPLSKPIRALWIALLLCGLEYCLVPISMDNLHGVAAFTVLLILMGLSGYLQSFVWPNLLPLVHSAFSPDKDTTILGFWATCPNFGNIIGFVVCQYIVLYNGLSWEFGMYIIAMYMVINALYIGLRVDQMPNEVKIQDLATNNGQSSFNNLQSQKQPLLKYQTFSSQDNIIIKTESSNQNNTLSKNQPAPQNIEPSLQKFNSQPKVIQVFKQSPRVTLLTISFSLLKSVMYGILLWLPAYFYSIGLVEYSLYIPMAFDGASIVGSTILGAILKRLPPNKKNAALIPVLFFLMIFFMMLKAIDFSVAGYFVIISLVGLCLGGSYNTMAGLVTMELVRTAPPQLQTKYLRFYSALLMAFANVITGITQIIISYTVGEDQGALFGIFVIYTAVNICSLTAVVFIQIYTVKTVNDNNNQRISTQPNKYANIKEQKQKPIINKTNNIETQNSPKYIQIQFQKIS